MGLTMLVENQSNYYGTTYRESYRCSNSQVLPPIKFHQLPALQLTDVPMLSTRGTFPLIQMGPHRRLQREIAIGPGLGSDVNTERLLDRKPIVRTEPPGQKVNRPPSGLKQRRRRGSAHRLRRVAATTRLIPSLLTSTPDETDVTQTVHNLPHDIIDNLCNSLTWTSTTRKATEEAKMPIREVVPPQTTFEENADMVKLRAQKYEPQPELWQKVATTWDVAQSRPRYDRPKCLTQETGLVTPPSKLLSRRHEQTNKRPVSQKTMDLVKNSKLAFSYDMPCPGYAGFVPRNPVEESLEGRPPHPSMVTIMKKSYRRMPADEYQIREYAHRDPMSSTVTLTYPYNPFNKVEKRCGV